MGPEQRKLERDLEMTAMKKIAAQLDLLPSAAARGRVLQWAVGRVAEERSAEPALELKMPAPAMQGHY